MLNKKLIFTILLLFADKSFANDQNPDSKQRNYYVPSKGYSSNPESDPPQYVKQLDQTGIAMFENINWIDAGIAHRTRFERRDNDFRRSVDLVDNQILSRVQAYFGVKNILDPIRFAVELQDSRSYNSHFPREERDVNKLDIFQAYGELYFKNPTLSDRPISLRAGRMAFEVLDRKLISRDDWGNTGTNFQGFRAIVGEKENDWQLDSFALQPVIKSMDKIDQENQNQWVYAGILNWRRWSDIVTLQPFYLQLDQKKSANSQQMQIYSPGIRLYGYVGDSNFDYGLIWVNQFGKKANQKHRALAYAAEIGYNHNHSFKPRYSLTYGYASGDKNPDDNKNQLFERFYGFNRPWSNSNHIEWGNIKALKSRVEIQPIKKLQIDGSYSFYWLASKTDQWNRANLQDKTGNSGDFIGQDFDLRARYTITKNVATTIGYAHFKPGKFATNTGRNNSSDFIYMELNLSLFGWGS